MKTNLENTIKATGEGFGNRLHALMDFAGLKRHGRGRLISKWTGLSDSTASYLFKYNRPPSEEHAVNIIVTRIIEAIKFGRDIDVYRGEVIDFLAIGKRFQALDGGGNRKDVEHKAALFTLLINACSELNIEMPMRDKKTKEGLIEIIKRVDKFIDVNEFEYENDIVYTFIKDMLKLHVSGKLRYSKK